MKNETFDFSEALRRMKEGKKVRRKIFADGTYAYIDKNYLGSEALMYNVVGRATPVLWLLPKTIFQPIGRRWKDDEERCCGNCLWMGREDILGNGWCYKKDCETSCDKVCKKHEF